MPGRTLAHYEILEEISRGGMGVVYRARDTSLGREIALKVLPDDLVHDTERRERLVQEARAASSLEHPNIAVIHAVGEAEGHTFIAMELIRGEKLSDALAGGAMAQKRALDLAIEIAEGLARAHDRGIVHRDLKPANVMVTEDGHAKIIDFGLAKLIEPASADTETALASAQGTDPGVVMGTASYMSPEQARGTTVDHRSDVFSFGVVLYEMLAGAPPFQGQSQLDTLHAILTEPIPDLPRRSGMPADVAMDVKRVIDKCAAKERDDRYQGMKDVVVDLRAARRRLESSASAPATATTASRNPTAGIGTTLVVSIGLVVVAAITMWFWRPWEAASTAGAPDGKPAVAVLYFENQTGDDSLDWMRTGLADMMVTDLSQDATIEVLGTDRLFQILEELGRADDQRISADVVQQVARRAGVDRVLVGSYIKAGETIRISARLQDADSGQIVTAERVEGAGESSLFSLVDELTRRIKTQMASLVGGPGTLLNRPGSGDERSLDRGVTEVTTTSIEAYRHYAEGINLHNRRLETQALPHFEEAIEIDPGFAMALIKASVVSSNLGFGDMRDEYARRAMEHTDRLTTRERYYIEGWYYTGRPDTYERGMQAYEQGLALHPEHEASRHNLAAAYSGLEQYDKAIQHYEELVRRGTSLSLTYGNLASIHRRLGNTARSVAIMEDFVARFPDSASGHEDLGDALLAAGRLTEADAAFERAMALDPQGNAARSDRVTVAFLGDRWEDAQALLSEMGSSPSPARRRTALIRTATLHRLRGQSAPALELYEQALRLQGTSTANRTDTLIDQAELFRDIGATSLALGAAEAAAADDQGDFEDLTAVFTLAQAQARAGRHTEANTTLARLEDMLDTVPDGPFKERSMAYLRGLLAHEAGDPTTAIGHLLRAESLSDPGGPNGPGPMTIRFLLASAYLAAGQDDEAATRLQWIVDVVNGRTIAPILYPRAHYLLAQIREQRGDMARARELYARFVHFWDDGDMSPEWVAEARQKIGG